MHLSSSAYIAASPSSLFPTRSVNRTQTTSLCHSTYNVTTLSKSDIETRYHFSPAEIQNSTHIIWSKGEYDPASGVEPLELPLVADRDRSRTLFALDVAHREDLFRSGEGDGAGVQKLRRLELEIFRGWLGS
jgi:dipeptidyl-peptidase-2/lysosomal Pro-X carboxypeptidase